MKKSSIFCFILISLVAWQCTRTESENSLKSSVDKGVAKINTAMEAISGTKGYELMTMTEDLTKSEIVINDSITLDLISGIYEFQPQSFICNRYYRPFWVFNMTGESDSLIVNLPQYLAFHPKHLHDVNPPDSVPENNFTIAASDYHLYYSLGDGFGYDYKLMAGLTFDTVNIGTIDIEAAGTSFSDNSYSSAYSFTDDYAVKVTYEAGDTATKSFYLLENDDILMKENVVFIHKDYHQSEWEYSLTIGDVDIVKSSEIDSVQVYLNGVLQSTAAEMITGEDENEASVCHHRDILLTFDDGTTAKLSELIGPSLITLRNLIPSMHTMCFARNVVDYIALTIYYRIYYN